MAKQSLASSDIDALVPGLCCAKHERPISHGGPT